MITVSSIKASFDSVFNSLRKPANVIPAIVMLCSMVKRPGLSCALSTSNILQSMSKQGIPTEPLPDGSPNLMNQLVASMTCEIIRAIKEDLNLQIALPPGSLMIQSTGANAGGPITTVGTNITSATGVGIAQ